MLSYLSVSFAGSGWLKKILTFLLFVNAIKCLTWRHIDFVNIQSIYDVISRFTYFLMIKWQLMLIYDTDVVTSRLFRKSFNCMYNPRIDYAVYLFTLKSSRKWRLPFFGATCNYNHQILPYGRLFLTFINTNVLYLLPLKLPWLHVKTMFFSFNTIDSYSP